MVAIPHPLTPADRPLVTGFLTRHPPVVSELTFTNLYIWRHSRPIFIAEHDGSLLFLIKTDEAGEGFVLLGPPAGAASMAEVVSAPPVKLAGAIRIPLEVADSLRQAGYSVRADRNNADYVYRVADLAELAGRKYAKKRNQIKQCVHQYDCVYEALNEGNIAECLAMQTRWCRLRACGRTPGLCGENLAISELLANYRELELIGGVIRVSGEIAAFTAGEQLHPGTAVCHVEKAMPGIQGLGQLITHWFARYGLRDFEYINREQDLGLPGLRQAKESYFPHHMVEKFILAMNGLPRTFNAPLKECELAG